MRKALYKFTYFWGSIFLSAWLLMLLSSPALHVSISFWRVVGISYIIHIVGALLTLDKSVKEFMETSEEESK